MPLGVGLHESLVVALVSGQFMSSIPWWKAATRSGVTHWVMSLAPGLCAQGLTSMQVAM
jgi:hypothetical protein